MTGEADVVADGGGQGASGSAPPAGRTALRVGFALIALMVLIVVPVVVKVVTSSVDTISGPRFDVPGTATVSLESGRHMIFERSGSQTSAGPITYTEQNGTTIRPEDVTITGPDGTAVEVGERGAATETVTVGSDIYTGAVEFEAATAGDYRIEVAGVPGGRVLVGRSIADVFSELVPWFVALGVAGVLGFVGMVLAIVGGVRRSRARRESRPPTPPPPGLGLGGAAPLPVPAPPPGPPPAPPPAAPPLAPPWGSPVAPPLPPSGPGTGWHAPG